MTHPPVIAGLDPAIHPAKPKGILGVMDARVEPAHGGLGGARSDRPKQEPA